MINFFSSGQTVMKRTAIVSAILASTVVATLPAQAQVNLAANSNDLIVSSASYIDPNVGIGSLLPNNSTAGGVAATASSAFCSNADCSVNVWNNDTPDPNFGVTAALTIQAVNANSGNVDASLNVTALAAAQGTNLVTSFSSKSELALNLTPDGSGITFMGYNSTTGKLDISNTQTPGGVEAGNTDTAPSTYRSIGQLNLTTNALQVTNTNAYSGNNGRAAVLGSNGNYYTVGNAGNGNGSAAVTAGTGVQLVVPGSAPGLNNVGFFNTTQAGNVADKTAKDNNFRGETIFNNTLYVTKGSGSNGINTVYQVGTAGSLPGAGNATPITVLPGFNTAPAKTATNGPHPFGLWFANSTTLYVADEGSGASTDFGASPTTQAGGVQKYSLVNGAWQLDYVLKGSLIGSSYTVNGTGSLAGSALTTTTDGFRNMTGKVNADGTVTLYAITSTEGSVLGDAGTDPNQLVAISDTLSYTTGTQAAAENFSVLQTASLGQVLRGVTVASVSAVPEPKGYLMLLLGLGMMLMVAVRRRKS